MTRISWETHLDIELQPVTPHDLVQLEEAWGITLPAEYKELVTAYQGMAPMPDIFDVGKSDNVFNVLLTVNRHEGHASYSVKRAYEVLKPLVPKGIFPFAKTPGGEFICFDYRNHPLPPKIVLVTVQASIHPIADNLTAFLNSLHD